MSSTVLQTLLRLFVSIARVGGVIEEERAAIRRFLEDHLNNTEVQQWMERFDALSADAADIDFQAYCRKIAAELSQKQQFIILLYLVELIYADGMVSPEEQAFMDIMIESFAVDKGDIDNMMAFVGAKAVPQLDDPALLLASAMQQTSGRARFLQTPVQGTLAILNLGEGLLYLIRFFGQEYLQLNHQYIAPKRNYVLRHGSVISLPHGKTLYFSDIVREYLDLEAAERITLSCEGLEYQFPNGNKGLRGVNIAEESGRLVAIMGASGSGKSTLLNVLNGNYAPSAGTIRLNGQDIHRNLNAVKGLIGYVPQDDLLVEELTVYQNLYYNARLCHRDKSGAELDDLVTKVLEDLGLSETRDLRVGNPLEKTISGGQRKRLNIGLELLRAPAIIFFDEPTSGLSSRDSENIMDLLKELTFKGKLIFVVIHQPSSEIFKMFDSLVILDTGGYPIYYGNPVEAVMYFKRVSEQVNHDQAACGECGNINSEQIFNIIETRVIDEYGNITNQRKISPQRWNQFFLERESQVMPGAEPVNDAPPASGLKRPSWLQQFSVFWQRDLRAKLGNRQYLTINILQAPLLAFILSILVRHAHSASGITGDYVFGQNDNIPAFFFMSIVVALFIGMTMSAEEIFRDRKILKRENFLNLSRSGYLLAKTSILFGFSALQMAVFVLISSLILELPGLGLAYWVMLFSLSSFAILLGLNISATFNSAVTIYILIPLLLIPQLILSGTVVKFDQLNPGLSSPKKVPFAADLMASRWAYEGIMVKYFRDNDYHRHFFDTEAQASDAVFHKDYWAPKLSSYVDWCLRHTELTNDSIREDYATHLRVLRAEVDQQVKETPQLNLPCREALDAEMLSAGTADCIKSWLKEIKQYYIRTWASAKESLDEIDGRIAQQFDDQDSYTHFIHAQHNDAIDKLVRNHDSPKRLVVAKDALVRTFEPIYHVQPPSGLTGYRTHFYAPKKTFFGVQIDTFTFNVLVIWSMTLLLYFTLHLEFFRWILRRLQRRK